jgi:diaminopimelate decarboxylase
LLAAEHGVRVHLESPGEYERLGALGLAQMPPVGIRVNPGKPQPGAKLRMADTSSRFGIDADDVPEFARRLARDGVTIHGLHVYGGSQSFDAEAWVATAAELLELADVVEDATGKALPSLNFGGGFGWPTHEGDPPSFDLHVAGEGLQRVLDARGERATRRTSYVELGRYLCAGGGVYLTRVVDKKRSGEKTQVVLDGGMHQFGAAAGLGAVLRRCYAIVSADDVHAERSERASLGGTLCTPADRFATDVPLPPLEPGSLVAILNAGAYGLSFSPARFLGHPSPAEVVVVNGAPRLARRRGEPTDVLRDQIVDGA